jgi:hypothetical protein
MGGDLTLESEEGVGSAFTLWLPTPEWRVEGPAAPVGGVAAATADRGGAPTAATPEEAAALVRIGAGLADAAGATVRAFVARLRADPTIPTGPAPGAAPYTDAELEDHALTLVTEVGLALRALGEGGPEPAALLRDGTAILRLIAERHGAQRVRLGWSEAALARESAILSDVLVAIVHRLAGGSDAPGAARATTAVAQVVAQSTRLSLGGFRLAVEPAPTRS